MKIQSSSVYAIYSHQNAVLRQDLGACINAADPSAYKANSADTVSISQGSRDLCAAQTESSSVSKGGRTAAFETDQGPKALNIEDYFQPDDNTGGKVALLGELPPLLLPTKSNIEALSEHISSAFPQFLAENNIPSAPSSITYDNKGQIQLPSDYAYTQEFKQALENNPAMERELRTLHAISSHYAGIQRGEAFRQEYALTSTQAEAEAVVEKYSYLFEGKHYDAINLLFSESGDLSISTDSLS